MCQSGQKLKILYVSGLNECGLLSPYYAFWICLPTKETPSIPNTIITVYAQIFINVIVSFASSAWPSGLSWIWK